MTFVPQPYEQFVSDLLTSLTGGRSREEHRFIGVEDAYSLTARGVMPESLRVTGQRNEQFADFELGIDFLFEEENQAIRWKTGGSLPDERTYFYVSYYPSEAPRRLTDRNPGSVTTILAEAFGREMAVLHRQMQAIYRSGFLDLASDSAVDHIVALLGLSRKDAKFASGEVLFKRSSPAPGDIVISAGTVVSTALGQNFETTDKRTLRRGQLSVVVPIRAQVEGPPGKVNAGEIANINRPLFGVDSVINEAATFFATQKETDEELRRRARGALERAGKSTVDAIKYSLIEDLPEITDTNIQVFEKADSPGFVEVRLGLESSAQPDLVRRVEESIFNSRPAGVRVTHNLPTRSTSSSARQATEITRDEALADFAVRGEPPGINHLPADALAAMPEGVLRIRAEAFIRLAEPNLSASQKESVEDQVRSILTDYIETLPMGAPLIYSKLLGRIAALEVVEDARMLVGAEHAGAFLSFEANLATDGRKARADAIFVGLMEENVYIDIAAVFETNPAVPVAAEGRPPQITPALEAAITNALNLTLAGAGTELDTANLAGAIRGAAAAVTPELQLVSQRPVSVNAEYEETGRVLSGTDRITLAPNEAPVLRKLSLKLQGALDV